MEYIKKEYSIPSEFILKAHSAACPEWKEKIEKVVPDLFKVTSLEPNNWYMVSRKQGSSAYILVCSDGKKQVGFNHSADWTSNYRDLAESIVDPNREVKKLSEEDINYLVKFRIENELSIRGIEPGTYFKNTPWCGSPFQLNSKSLDIKVHFTNGHHDSKFYVVAKGQDGGWFTVMEDGDWAQPIIMSVEEAEQTYGINIE